MSRKDFFEKLNDELDAITPPLSAALQAEPIASAPCPETAPEPEAAFVSASAGAGGHTGGSFKRTRLPALLLAGVLFFVLLAGVLLLALPCGGVSLLSLDINPSVQLVLGANGRVEAVVSGNADGDTVLLSEEGFASSLVGMRAEEAAVALTDRAAQTGYLDVFNEGSAKEYNEVTLLLTGGNASKERAEEIAAAVTAHSRSEGVYLYVSAGAVREDAASEAASLTEDAALYYARIHEAETLAAYAESSAYAYAETLLADALKKYDLFCGIQTLNEQLAEACGETLGAFPDTASYWYWREREDASEQISALCEEAARALAEMRLRFGQEWDSYFSFQVAYTAYMFAASAVSEEDVAELRGLLEEGIGRENFGGAENFSVRLKYYNFVGSDLLQTVFSALFGGGTGTTEELFSVLSSLIASEAQALYLRYSALFSLPRAAIGDEQYAAFLARIGKAG